MRDAGGNLPDRQIYKKIRVSANSACRPEAGGPSNLPLCRLHALYGRLPKTEHKKLKILTAREIKNPRNRQKYLKIRKILSIFA
ncbi:MAG: hypothetical protein K2G75_01770, partial [Muribaculaceae bacterium]|nr:hypothetical protein [Muribaculaceae bacterium]